MCLNWGCNVSRSRGRHGLLQSNIVNHNWDLICKWSFLSEQKSKNMIFPSAVNLPTHTGHILNLLKWCSFNNLGLSVKLMQQVDFFFFFKYAIALFYTCESSNATLTVEYISVSKRFLGGVPPQIYLVRSTLVMPGGPLTSKNSS